MRVILIFLLLLLGISPAYSETTAPTELINGSYGFFFTPEYNTYGEGVILSTDFFERSTKLTFGLLYTFYDDEQTINKPINLTAKGDGEGIFGNFEFDIKLGDITYNSTRHHNFYDGFLMGEYNYWNLFYNLGDNTTKETFDLRTYLGGGARFSFASESVTYKIYTKNKYLDSIENPISEGDSDGIKFFISNSVTARISHAHIGIIPALSIPDIKKSFLILLMGLSI